jgi:hypothetical protein
MRKTAKKPDQVIETIFETENKLKRKATAVLEEAKKAEKIKLKNGYAWETIDGKTKVLKKNTANFN